MYVASWFDKRPKDVVKCVLCPHVCEIKSGHVGKCRVKVNEEGVLYSKNYGQAAPVALDPIEKKPLFHFYPGTNIFSVGSYGCNLQCSFCQNWHIAHEVSEGKYFSPEQLAEVALEYNKEKKSIGMAYTYSEPCMWYEYIMDIAPLISEKGMKNILVTNGFLNKKPFRSMLEHIHALNIDIKAFTDRFYKDLCGGFLKPVLDSCMLAKEEGCHLEVTTLIIPGFNDNADEIKELSKWLASIDKNIPLHISRYFPSYKLQVEATPVRVLEDAWLAAKEHLEFVYIGNAPSLMKLDTYCPECGEVIILRSIYKSEMLLSDKGECVKCGNKVKGIIV